ncbi:MAG: alpha/beta hydrolase [Bryobacteraceae bacterium]
MRALLILALTSLASAATIDGFQVHSTVHGTGPKTIIFVHGWTCDETSWDQQVPAFEKDYRVITLDLPGHGKSGAPKSEALSMTLFARAIEAVRVEAKAGNVVLVGHSMGVPVIRQYARMFPTHVAGLVPVDGPIHFSGNPAPDPEPMKGAQGLKNREGMIRGMFGKSATPAMQEQVVKMMLAPSESTAIQAMASMYVASNWTEEVMRFPVLAIYPDHSQANDSKYTKKIFPNSKIVEVPGTGHFVMLEKPTEFNKLLADFLAKVKF